MREYRTPLTIVRASGDVQADSLSSGPKCKALETRASTSLLEWKGGKKIVSTGGRTHIGFIRRLLLCRALTRRLYLMFCSRTPPPSLPAICSVSERRGISLCRADFIASLVKPRASPGEQHEALEPWHRGRRAARLPPPGAVSRFSLGSFHCREKSVTQGRPFPAAFPSSISSALAHEGQFVSFVHAAHAAVAWFCAAGIVPPRGGSCSICDLSEPPPRQAFLAGVLLLSAPRVHVWRVVQPSCYS